MIIRSKFPNILAFFFAGIVRSEVKERVELLPSGPSWPVLG